MPELIIRFTDDYQSGRNTDFPLFSDAPASDFDYQSGGHDENGIFIACGPNIKKDIELPAANLHDMAPTILYAMGLSVPENMDGTVLLDVFENEFLKGNPLPTVQSTTYLKSTKYELSESEEKEMIDQLMGLGYM